MEVELVELVESLRVSLAELLSEVCIVAAVDASVKHRCEFDMHDRAREVLARVDEMYRLQDAGSLV